MFKVSRTEEEDENQTLPRLGRSKRRKTEQKVSLLFDMTTKRLKRDCRYRWNQCSYILLLGSAEYVYRGDKLISSDKMNPFVRTAWTNDFMKLLLILLIACILTPVKPNPPPAPN